MKDIVVRGFEESIRLKRDFLTRKNIDIIVSMARCIGHAFEKGNKLLLFGNGGSAADAQHLAAEFVNRFRVDRRPLPAMALTTDSSVLTSISNDYNYSDVFSKQIMALGSKGDIAWGISTSGRSLNVIKGLKIAKENGLATIALSGGDGGEIVSIADMALVVNSNDTPRIQEIHITVGHTICELIDFLLEGSALDI